MKKIMITSLTLIAVIGTVLSTTAPAEATVTWHGGPVLPNVQIEKLYLGSSWNTAGGRDWVGKLDGFVGYLVQSPFMDALSRAGYGVGRGRAYQGRILPYVLNSKQWLQDAAIRNAVQNAIYQGALQPNSNSLYVVYVEGGIGVVSSTGQVSTKDFLGYHSYFVGKDAAGRQAYIVYAVITLPVAPNPTSRGFPSDFAEVTSTTSHEIAEAVTDTLMNGWFDGQSEIGDLAVGNYQYLNGYYVQMIADRQDRPMRLTSERIYTPQDWQK
jgi:hypothetical protein